MDSRRLFICLIVLLCTSHGTGQYYYSNNINNRPLPLISAPPASAAGASLQCGRLWDAAYFQGRTIDLGLNEKRTDLGGFNFRPQAVNVKSGCGLTIFDESGNNQVLHADTHWLPWTQRVSASCCECNGCGGESARNGLQCARLYEHERCNGCTGFRVDFKNGDRVKVFGVLNDLMSSVIIRPGCHLVVYDKPDFMSWRTNLTTSSNLLGENWFKNISSAECSCSYNPNPVTPYPVPTPTQYTTPYSVPTTTQYTTPYPVPTTTQYTTPYPMPTRYTEPTTQWTSTTQYPRPSTTTTTRYTTTTTRTPIEESESWEPISEEVDFITTTTTTKPKTTTEKDSWEDIYEEEETTTRESIPAMGEDDSLELESKEDVTTTIKPTTTTTTPDYDDTSDEDDDFFNSDEDDEEEIVPSTTTTTTPKPVTTTTTRVTTTKTTTPAEEEEGDWDDW